MQLVGQRTISPDDDEVIPEHPPELNGKEVLIGFDDTPEKPVLEPRENKIRVRQLVMHSNGTSIFVFDQKFVRLHECKS